MPGLGKSCWKKQGTGCPLPLGRLLPDSWCPPWLCWGGEQSQSGSIWVLPPPRPPNLPVPTPALGSSETASLECAPVRALFSGNHMCLWLQCLGLVCRAGGEREAEREKATGRNWIRMLLPYTWIDLSPVRVCTPSPPHHIPKTQRG